MALRTPVAALAVALIAALLLAAPSSAQDSSSSIDATAELFTTYVPQDASVVYVARADDYADALAGAGLAASNNAGVLFVDGDALADSVVAALTGTSPDEIVILGGTAAVSEAIQQELNDYAPTRRLAGANRFETAVAVADELLGVGTDDEATPSTLLFVEGENADPARGWPDAVNAATISGLATSPILPVNAERLPAEITAFVERYPDAERLIVGGSAAVSDDVAAEIAAIGASEDGGFAGEDGPTPPARLAGDTRYGTSAEAYNYAVNQLGAAPVTRFVVPGCSYAEGIAAGAIAAANGWTVLMVDCENVEASAETLALLGSALDLLDQIVVVGESLFGEDVLAAIEAADDSEPVEAAFCLRLLHHNDGESDIFPSDDGYGGMANIVTLANTLQELPLDEGCEDGGTVTVTSGDNFLAGPEFSASLERGEDEPIYDALGLSLMNYDALDLGNHDFDFNPDVTERFITSFTGDDPPPFLSANLDFSAEPGLQALVDAGRIAPSTTVDVGESQVGIIGLTTPNLATISSPRDVEVLQNITEIVQGEIDALTDAGVDKVVLISHLQGIEGDDGDLSLIADLTGVDAVVAGGGDEVLADPGDPLIPGDEENVFDSYPIVTPDADGLDVPVVTTSGNYNYLGRLELRFAADGNLLADAPFIDGISRMVRVANEPLPDGVAANQTVVDEVYGPIQAFVDDLESTVVADSEVRLNGDRPDIRVSEQNSGNLVADSQTWFARTAGEGFGLNPDATFVGIQNGGGIRHDGEDIGPGEITVLDTFSMVPFPNFVAAFEDFTIDELKQLLERAYFDIEGVNGAFAQVSNLVVEVDVSQQAQEQDEDGTITTPGERVRSLTLGDGTPLITDGEVVEGAPTVTLTIVDFGARGGDGYPLDGDFEVLGRSYQQVLEDYIVAPTDEGGLGGAITAEQYPEGGEGRITITGLE